METVNHSKAFCSQCGTELEDGALFCSSCGAKQEKTSAAASLPNNPLKPPTTQTNPPSMQAFPQQQIQQPYIPPQMTTGQKPKSMVLALVLSFFFGPLGLLYASKKAGLIMICVLLAVAFLVNFQNMVLWQLLTILISMVWAYMEVDKYNKALMSGQMPPQSF